MVKQERNRSNNEHPTKGLCFDMRHLRTHQLIEPNDIRVDEETLAALIGHVNEGLFELGIKYYGITPKEFLEGKKVYSGPNCTDQTYTNAFVSDEGYFNVHIFSPSAD